MLHRLHLFVRPGGMLIVDIRDPASFRALDGGTFVDETDDVLCLWRAEFDAAAQTMHYGMRGSSGRARRRSTLSMRTRRSGSRSCSHRRVFWT